MALLTGPNGAEFEFDPDTAPAGVLSRIESGELTVTEAPVAPVAEADTPEPKPKRAPAKKRAPKKADS